ncbi:hypothetical protein Ddc_23519 [Ditylenchus destructor]|nr:hypothetical protein Ddc_23519 [Ditylenchus destructor]
MLDDPSSQLFLSVPPHILAAGCHDANTSDGVLDRVESSYSPSIKALLHAHQNARQRKIVKAPRKALLMSMHTTHQTSVET